MEELKSKFGQLENKIIRLIEKLNSVEKKKNILIEENIRLKEENNQLLRVGASKTVDSVRMDDNEVKVKKNINIDYLKREFDNCIDEVEKCIAESKRNA